MSRTVDLKKLLDSWPYDPDDNVRLVEGDDGREILQVRLPSGIEQYEVKGRPDGERPHGYESLLDYHLDRLRQAQAEGAEEEFALDHEACAELFFEGTLYYYRYLHFFQLKEWRRTLRDTTRNIRLFDFVHRYAEREEDRMYLEQWRPYILRIQAVAAAMVEIEKGHFDKGQVLIRRAIRRIERLEELDDETFKFELQRSLIALRELAGQIEASRPLSRIERLERELRQAIEAQAFERAAELRDQIRALREEQSDEA